MALGLLFSACSEDLANEQGNKVAEFDKTLYVNMNIRGDILSGSRAASTNGTPTESDDFENGSPAESKVQNAYFVFYDANDNLVGEIVKVELPEAKTTGVSGTVEKYYQSVVPVSVYKGESDPTQVVCYINPITPASLQNPLNVIQTYTRDILYSGEGESRLFAMSNSVYYPTEGTEDPQIAVPIPAGSLFKSKADAEAALKPNDAGKTPNVVDIYVERYAAKLKFKKSATTAYTTATSLINNPAEVSVVLTFNPQRWALNAACEETYIVKSFRKETKNGQMLPDNYKYDVLNDRINASAFKLNESEEIEYETPLTPANSWDWNNPAFHRSYWGMSPAYFTNSYPEVASDIVPANLHQKYYTYDELTSATSPAGFEAGDETDHYFHETTVGAKALLSKNPAAATPSVILVGNYSMTVGGTTVSGNPTFYTYLSGSNGNPLVYFEAEGAQGTSTVTGGESMLRRFIEQISILFKKDASDNFIPFDITSTTDMASLVAVLEVAAPSDAVKGADMKVAERYRTLQFKSDATAARLAGIYMATPDGYKTINQTAGDNNLSLVDANKALMQQVGFCNMYNTGAAYFNIPVKHYGWYRPGNDQIDATTIDWSKVRIGDFGVVRNHSYAINVQSIKGLATGIGGMDTPIVPPADTKDYFVAYRVNILKWAFVPTQNVNL